MSAKYMELLYLATSSSLLSEACVGTAKVPASTDGDPDVCTWGRCCAEAAEAAGIPGSQRGKDHDVCQPATEPRQRTDSRVNTLALAAEPGI